MSSWHTRRYLPTATMALLALAIGCDTAGQFIEVTAATNSELSQNLPAMVNGVTGAGPSYFDQTAGDMGGVRYRLDQQRRAFVLDSALGATASPTSKVIHLPLTSSYSEVASHVITDLDPSKPWNSVRIYDTGECSLAIPLHVPDGGSVPYDINDDGVTDSLVFTVVSGIAEQVARGGITRPVELVQWSAHPFLRMARDDDPVAGPAGILRRSLDFIRFSMTISPAKIVLGNCTNPKITISFDLATTAPTGSFTVDHSACAIGDLCSLHQQGIPDALAPYFSISQSSEGVTRLVDTVEGSLSNLEVCENHFSGGPITDLHDPHQSPHMPEVLQPFVRTQLGTSGGICLVGQARDVLVEDYCFRVAEGDDFGTFRPTVRNLAVDVEDCGPVVSGKVAAQIRSLLPTLLPTQMETAIGTFASEPTGRSCTASCECDVIDSDGRLVAGQRGVCDGDGECRTVFEVERAYIRPDAIDALAPLGSLLDAIGRGTLEVVVAETSADPQFGSITAQSGSDPADLLRCDEGRLSIPYGGEPELLNTGWPMTGGGETTF